MFLSNIFKVTLSTRKTSLIFQCFAFILYLNLKRNRQTIAQVSLPTYKTTYFRFSNWNVVVYVIWLCLFVYMCFRVWRAYTIKLFCPICIQIHKSFNAKIEDAAEISASSNYSSWRESIESQFCRIGGRIFSVPKFFFNLLEKFIGKQLKFSHDNCVMV